MASHGNNRRVQHEIRAHSAPKPQGMPFWLPTTSQHRPLHTVDPARPGPTHTHTGRAITALSWPQKGHTRALADPTASMCPIVSAHVVRAARTGLRSHRDLHDPQPAAELHTSKQGEKRAWGDRAPSGRIASHALASAPGVDSSHHCKHTPQHKPFGGRPTRWRRTDGALSAAALSAVARARSKAHERAMQRLPRQVSVREAAYI